MRARPHVLMHLGFRHQTVKGNLERDRARPETQGPTDEGNLPVDHLVTEVRVERLRFECLVHQAQAGEVLPQTAGLATKFPLPPDCRKPTG